MGEAEVPAGPTSQIQQRQISPLGVFMHHVSILGVPLILQTNTQGGRRKREGVHLEGWLWVCECTWGLWHGCACWSVCLQSVWGMSTAGRGLPDCPGGTGAQGPQGWAP